MAMAAHFDQALMLCCVLCFCDKNVFYAVFTRCLQFPANVVEDEEEVAV